MLWVLVRSYATAWHNYVRLTSDHLSICPAHSTLTASSTFAELSNLRYKNVINNNNNNNMSKLMLKFYGKTIIRR